MEAVPLRLMFLDYFNLFIGACEVTHKRRIINSAKDLFGPLYSVDDKEKGHTLPAQQ